jgi:hypothetical protein
LGVAPTEGSVDEVRHASTSNTGCCHDAPKENGPVGLHLELAQERDNEDADQNKRRLCVTKIEGLGEKVREGLAEGSASHLLAPVDHGEGRDLEVRVLHRVDYLVPYLSAEHTLVGWYSVFLVQDHGSPQLLNAEKFSLEK